MLIKGTDKTMKAWKMVGTSGWLVVILEGFLGSRDF